VEAAERGHAGVLSEEALIVLAAFGACGLLVLGVLELLWPTRSRHPVRRAPAVVTRASRPHRTSALTRHALGPGRDPYARRGAAAALSAPTAKPALLPAPSPPRPAAASVAPIVPAPVAEAAGVLEAAEVGAVAQAEEEATRPADVAEVAGVPDVPVAASALLATGVPVVAACLALHQEGRHAEAIEAATAAVAIGPGAATAAALWSVVALARQAQGEPQEARLALQSAIEAAPAGERPAYRRQLAALAEAAARDRLADAERHSRPDSEQRLAALREAAAWLACGLAAAPASGALAETMAGCQALLWPAWERTVMVLVQRQDFRAARRLLHEALADPRFPSSRGETFRGLFSGTFSGEIGQLTAQAIRSVQDAREADALGALQRAEALLGALNDEALPPRRREEVDRRLWWGYRALGERRLASGECEAALEPLLHALGYRVGPEQQEETRALVLRALDGVADARALGIRELADAGDREAALVHCDRLWALLRSAGDRGLSPTDLGAVHRKVQRLFESLGR
jgi:tetratricopeptide (TPR) repeat protein